MVVAELVSRKTKISFRMLSLPELSHGWLFDAQRWCSKAVSEISDVLIAHGIRKEERRQNPAQSRGLDPPLLTVGNVHGIGRPIQLMKAEGYRCSDMCLALKRRANCPHVFFAHAVRQGASGLLVELLSIQVA